MFGWFKTDRKTTDNGGNYGGRSDYRGSNDSYNYDSDNNFSGYSTYREDKGCIDNFDSDGCYNGREEKVGNEIHIYDSNGCRVGRKVPTGNGELAIYDEYGCITGYESEY